MSTDNENSSAKAATVVIGKMMRLAGENPKARAAASELGQAALTVTKTISAALLPLAALNYGIERARIYFSTKFQNEFAENAKESLPKNLLNLDHHWPALRFRDSHSLTKRTSFVKCSSICWLPRWTGGNKAKPIQHSLK